MSTSNVCRPYNAFLHFSAIQDFSCCHEQFPYNCGRFRRCSRGQKYCSWPAFGTKILHYQVGKDKRRSSSCLCLPERKAEREGLDITSELKCRSPGRPAQVDNNLLEHLGFLGFLPSLERLQARPQALGLELSCCLHLPAAGQA